MKIQVASVKAKKQGTKNGKAWTISEVETIEGNKYDTFDAFEAGKEYEVTMTPNANPKYNANIRKEKADSGYASQKQAAAVAAVKENADEKEQRITMLSCISSASQFYQQRQGTEKDVTNFAKELFHIAMTHRLDNPPF